jgi:dienelactone hydrolase
MIMSCILSSGMLAGQPADAETARAEFASLLKIPVEPPEIRVLLGSRKWVEELWIEDLSWESLDGEVVPAFLVGPKNSRGKHPAVICLHGSSGSRDSMVTEAFGRGEWIRPGRTEPHRRLLGWARELARRGFIALAMTQRGLDRRVPNTNDRAKAMLVRGRNLMGAIVYEIRQAITLLEQREDVGRIGLAGMSFGGITGFYTWLVDGRVDALASICGGVGSIEVFLNKGSLPYHGFYWWVPNILLSGDHGDYVARQAPRAIFLWAPLEDIGMPKEGIDQLLARAGPAYQGLGYPGRLEVQRPQGGHVFSLAAFEHMYQFLQKRLQNGVR